MINRIIDFSVNNKVVVFLLVAAAALTGWWSLRHVPLDAIPDLSDTQVIVYSRWDRSPDIVEDQVTYPIVTAMLGAPRVKAVRGFSDFGYSFVYVIFEDGTDIYWARQQVAERLSAAMGDLPAGVSGGLAPITTPLSEMFMFTVEGPLPLDERRAILDWVIRPQLRTLAGVADVNSLGGFARTFEVAPDNAAMSARGVTLPELMAALETNLRNDGAGRLAEGEEVWVVRIEGAVKSLDDLAAIVVKRVGGVPVRVADVAQVRLSSLTRYGGVTQDGKGEAVEGLVLGLKGANAQNVVALVKQRLKEIAPGLPRGVTVQPFYDRSQLVERAIGTVSHALMEAVVLVLVLLFLFLGNVRAALTVAVVLPLSALAAFWLMRRFGLSANLMSLGGLAIAIGLLVDAAVVVVENIVTRLSNPGLAHASGTPKLHEVYRAVREVSAPTAAGVLIILIVFLPLLSLEGLEGKLFIPVALTIVFALGAALFLSLTVVPALGALLIQEGAHEEPWLMRQLERAYRPLLDWALGHFRLVIAGALALLLAAAAIYPFIGKSFMPTLDEGDLLIQLEKLPSISLEASLDIDLRVQRALLARVPEIKGVVARAGSDELGLDPMSLNQTDTFLVLKPKEEWRRPDKEWLTEEIRKVMADFPGVTFGFTQPIDMRVSEMLTGSRGDLAVKVFGPDLGTLNRLAGEIETLLGGIPGAQDVFSVKNDGVQYFRVEIDRLALGRHGLTADEVSDFLKAHLEGVRVGVIQEGARRTPLVVRAGENVRASPALFERLRIPTNDGLAVPLAEVAHLVRAEGPVAVNRENGARYVVIQSNVAGRDLVGFVEDVKRAVAAKVRLPQGYSVVYGGQFENQQRAAMRLAVVVPVALGLIFLLLFATFQSWRQAALIMANAPFALVGGVMALGITGEYLSVPASVGFIALLGIAVLNGVVLVSYFNQLRDQGMVAAGVVREGSLRRLRPVMMTASITAFGLLPLLTASGPGSEIQKPLAIVVMGGLFTSTVLTLLVLPVLYRRFILGAKA